VRAKKEIIQSIAVSIVVHMVFLIMSFGIPVSNKYVKTQRMKRTFKIKTLKSKLPEKKPLPKRETIYIETLKFQKPAQSDLSETLAEISEAIEKKKDFELQKKEIEEPIKLTKKDAVSVLKENKSDYKHLEQSPQRETRKNIVEITAPAQGDNWADYEAFLKQADFGEEFIDKMPGFTPRLTGDMAEEGLKAGRAQSMSGRYRPVIERRINYENLQGYLASYLEVYEDPNEGEKYFKISIKVGARAQTMPTIPKEIVFLVDCSKSILEGRLEEFKDGLRYILNNLNENDTFNILAFKKRRTKFSPVSVKPTVSNKAQALRFISQLTVGEKTDTYNALYRTITEENISQPSYLILLSDGRATQVGLIFQDVKVGRLYIKLLTKDIDLINKRLISTSSLKLSD